MMPRLILVLLGGILLYLLLPSDTLAQTPSAAGDAFTAPTVPTVKEYGRPGYPKITIYVWGNADTGVWSVERGTDLLEFVSVVSRVQLADKSPDRRLIQKLSIYRHTDRTGKPFFESQIEELFSDRQGYPAIEEGDILVLETEARNRFTWRDVARVTGTVAAVLNTFLLVDRLRK